MIRTCKLSAVGLMLLCLTGCGDSPANIIHDCLVFWNEACDYMLLANTNERAKDLLDLEFNKLLKAKHEAIKERIKMRFDNIDKDGKADYNSAWLDYHDEKVATGKRLFAARKRLDGIIKNTSGPTDELQKLRDWPKTFMFEASDANPSISGNDPGPKGYPRWGDGLVPKTFAPVTARGRSAWVGSPDKAPAPK